MKEYTMQQVKQVVTHTTIDPEPSSTDIAALVVELKAVILNDSWLDNVVKAIKASNISKYSQGYICRIIDEDKSIFLDHERADFRREIISYVCKYGGSE